MSISGVVLAAGLGERLGLGANKVWASVGGVTLLAHAVRGLLATGLLTELVVVLRPEEEPQARALAACCEVPLRTVVGGIRRQDSARKGVEAATGAYVLVHDAARPVINKTVVAAVMEAARRDGAAVPVVPVADTLRYVSEGGGLEQAGPTRHGLVHVQTPQGFRRELLLQAYAAVAEQDASLPDDAAALLRMGRAVAVVPGDPAMLKVTRPEDLKVVASLLASGG